MSFDKSKIESIFEKALDVPVAELSAWLDLQCGDDRALKEELEQLLEAYGKSGKFLSGEDTDLTQNDTFPGSAAPGIPREANGPDLGRVEGTIGPYKLLQQIGIGGFGVVYMAEQTAPVKRRVALKIIKLGMDSEQVVARFEAERQALALMNHPNIARVFDAGTTSRGRPYFVMELVRGAPITDYCDREGLGIEARLKLFEEVCKAIQHAHQRGVIHRDIKPSNVLVTLQDGEPLPKVIDFGIAKATQQELTTRTIFTRFEQFIGTPAYMSPEQAGQSGVDIDTRSDIYSLGVLLYVLLTGATPIDTTSIMEGGVREIRRRIQEEEPAKPSTRISTLKDQSRTTVAGARRSSVEDLKRKLSGDLDWIVMKALEKNRDRRYDGANAFAQDVERYLRNEPVTAAPPDKAYLLKKFLARNKAPIAAAGALALTMALTTIFLLGLTQYMRDQENLLREQRRTEEFARLEAQNAVKEANRLAEELQRETAEAKLELNRFYKEDVLAAEKETDYPKAFELLIEATEAHPEDPEIAPLLRKLLEKNFAEPPRTSGDQTIEKATARSNALSATKRIVCLSPSIADHHEILGNLLLGTIGSEHSETERMEAYDEAIRSMVRATDLEPENPERWELLGKTYQFAAANVEATERQFEWKRRAVDAFQACVKLDEEDPMKWIALSAAQFSIDLNLSEESLIRALALDSSHYISWMRLLTVTLAQDRRERALEVLEELERRYSTEPGMYSDAAREFLGSLSDGSQPEEWKLEIAEALLRAAFQMVSESNVESFEVNYYESQPENFGLSRYSRGDRPTRVAVSQKTKRERYTERSFIILQMAHVFIQLGKTDELERLLQTHIPLLKRDHDLLDYFLETRQLAKWEQNLHVLPRDYYDPYLGPGPTLVALLLRRKEIEEVITTSLEHASSLRITSFLERVRGLMSDLETKPLVPNSLFHRHEWRIAFHGDGAKNGAELRTRRPLGIPGQMEFRSASGSLNNSQTLPVEWQTEAIRMRAEFDLDAIPEAPPVFRIRAVGSFRIFLNDVEVLQISSENAESRVIPFSADAMRALRLGANEIMVAGKNKKRVTGREEFQITGGFPSATYWPRGINYRIPEANHYVGGIDIGLYAPDPSVAVEKRYREYLGALRDALYERVENHHIQERMTYLYRPWIGEITTILEGQDRFVEFLPDPNLPVPVIDAIEVDSGFLDVKSSWPEPPADQSPAYAILEIGESQVASAEPLVKAQVLDGATAIKVPVFQLKPETTYDICVQYFTSAGRFTPKSVPAKYRTRDYVSRQTPLDLKEVFNADGVFGIEESAENALDFSGLLLFEDGRDFEFFDGRRTARGLPNNGLAEGFRLAEPEGENVIHLGDGVLANRTNGRIEIDVPSGQYCALRYLSSGNRPSDLPVILKYDDGTMERRNLYSEPFRIIDEGIHAALLRRHFSGEWFFPRVHLHDGIFHTDGVLPAVVGNDSGSGNDSRLGVHGVVTSGFLDVDSQKTLVGVELDYRDEEQRGGWRSPVSINVYALTLVEYREAGADSGEKD